MKTFLLVLILGLLAVAQTTPVPTVTQIPTTAEDEVLREAVTDGFLVDHFSPPELTGVSAKSNVTAPPSQRPSSDPRTSTTAVSVPHGGDHHATTTRSASPTHSSSTVSSTESSTEPPTVSPTESPTEPPTVSSMVSSTESSTEPSAVSSAVSSTATSRTTAAVSTFYFPSTLSSVSGSRHGEVPSEDTTTTTTAPSTSAFTILVQLRLSGEGEGSGSGMLETSTAPPTTTAARIRSRLLGDGEGSGSGMTTEISTTPSTTTLMQPEVRVLIDTGDESLLGNSRNNPSTQGGHEPHKVDEVANSPSPQGKDGGTPGWIIILAFIVGIAALVMLLAAIATRDKWNKTTSKLSGPETKIVSSDQQRGQEMETFLHKDEPRENGKSDEYTVIPLEELPEDYSSH